MADDLYGLTCVRYVFSVVGLLAPRSCLYARVINISLKKDEHSITFKADSRL